MKFSIITITYNAATYLYQTLDSVVQQTFSDFEHIVWDGGSSDGTLEIVRLFPHLKLYVGKDKGIADAMNQAVEYATGDFLLFLHADDLLAHPAVLSMAALVLKQHPSIEWIYGRAYLIDDKSMIKRTTPYEPYSFKRLRRYNFITHPSTFVKRTLFEKVGKFRKDLRYCMDYDLWLRLSLVSSPLAVAAVFSKFREHQNSLSTSEPMHVTDEAYRVRNRHVWGLLERYLSYRTWKKRRKKKPWGKKIYID